MTNTDLADINARRQAEGLELYANTRNTAAGGIKLLDPQKCAERRLRFYCHGVGYAEGLPVEDALGVFATRPANGACRPRRSPSGSTVSPLPWSIARTSSASCTNLISKSTAWC